MPCIIHDQYLLPLHLTDYFPESVASPLDQDPVRLPGHEVQGLRAKRCHYAASARTVGAECVCGVGG